MKRREFISLLGGTAAAWPLAVRAQQAKAATIGLLCTGSAAAQSQWTATFVQRMRELGWVEGRNFALEYRWAGGSTERLSELANELVRLKVAVIVTHNTPGPLAAKQATSTIPIVFATAGDPVGTGIVASLAQPGGNVTGLSSQTPDVAGKRLELLRQMVPGLHRLAVLADTDNPFVKLDVSHLRQAGAGPGHAPEPPCAIRRCRCNERRHRTPGRPIPPSEAVLFCRHGHAVIALGKPPQLFATDWIGKAIGQRSALLSAACQRS